MDKYKMGGHKLLWHLDRVQAWQKGERIAPLSIDVIFDVNIVLARCRGMDIKIRLM